MTTMTRRKKDNRLTPRQDERLIPAEDEPIEQIEPPKARAFVPPACSRCTALRPSNTNYTRVYSVHGQIRYCKCDFCGNTYKAVE